MSGPARSADIEVSIAWSLGRPAPSGIGSRILLSRDAMSYIGEAARLLRETSALDDFELRGVVIRLERPGGDTSGRVTVLGFVEGQPRQVLVELAEPDYQSAVQAHKERVPVRCTGDLGREGRRFVLRSARHLTLERQLAEEG